MVLLFLLLICDYCTQSQSSRHFRPPSSITPPISLLELVQKWEPDWITIQQIVRSNIDLIKSPIDINSNMYLLHYACMKRAPLKFVIELINKYPKACEEKINNNGTFLNNPGSLPLHLAFRLYQSESVIQLLISKYPKACEEKDYFGKLPLHFAIRCHASLSVIQLLVRQWPESIICRGLGSIKTPLDLAKEPFMANQEVIDWLESVTPAEIKRRYETYAFILNNIG